MPGLTESELARLKATKSEDEWNAACDAVKDARGGQYPHDWYQKVLGSNWIAPLHASFNQDEVDL